MSALLLPTSGPSAPVLLASPSLIFDQSALILFALLSATPSLLALALANTLIYPTQQLDIRTTSGAYI